MLKSRITAVILVLIFCISNITVFAQSGDNTKPSELLGAIAYLSENPGRWTIVAFNAAGATPDSNAVREMKTAVKGNVKTGYTKITDLAYDILSASAGGYDATNLADHNLIDLLAGRNDMLQQGANGPIFALLALDSCGYPLPDQAKWSRENLCEAILTYQTNDGGFRLDDTMGADVDVTAYALMALSRYSENAEVSRAIDRAVDWLMQVQNEDASFSSLGTPCSESTASVIMALISLGIRVYGERFSKDGITVYDALLSFQNSDGSFSHIAGGAGNVLATEQAVMAMGAVCFGKSPFRLAAVTAPTDTAGISASFLFFTVGIIVLIYLILLLVRKIGDRYAKKPSKPDADRITNSPESSDSQQQNPWQKGGRTGETKTSCTRLTRYRCAVCQLR